MKKWIALAMALVLALSLAACGGTTENKFAVGSVTTNKYTNTFAGICVELDSNWTFKTDAEIEQNNKEALNMMGDDYKQALENANVFTDMMATHANGHDTVNVTFEKLSGTNLLMTEESYANASKENTKSALESMGMTNVVLTVSKGTFAGQEHTFIDITASYAGVAVYEKVAVVKVSGYMVLVTACTWQTNTTKDILDMFKPVSV